MAEWLHNVCLLGMQVEVIDAKSGAHLVSFWTAAGGALCGWIAQTVQTNCCNSSRPALEAAWSAVTLGGFVSGQLVRPSWLVSTSDSIWCSISP